MAIVFLQGVHYNLGLIAGGFLPNKDIHVIYKLMLIIIESCDSNTGFLAQFLLVIDHYERIALSQI